MISQGDLPINHKDIQFSVYGQSSPSSHETQQLTRFSPPATDPKVTDPIFCPAGTDVIADFWTFNRDPKGVFGPDAEEFKPERWDVLQLEAWNNMTFDNELRTCLGRYKALDEALCLLMRFAQTFEKLESRDKKPYAGALQLVGRNKNGCHVAFIGKEKAVS